MFFLSGDFMRFFLFLLTYLYCFPSFSQTLLQERHPILGGFGRMLEGAEVTDAFETALLAYTTAKFASIVVEHEIHKHPDYTENVLENHPEAIPEFTRKIKVLPWGYDYLQSIGVGEEFYQQQVNLENTQEWKQAKAKIETDVIAVVDARYNNKEPPDCQDSDKRLEIYSSLNKYPNSLEMQTLNNKLESKGLNFPRSNGYFYEFYVNNYNYANKAPRTKDLDRDIKIEWENLKKNTTVIGVNSYEHSLGRTFKGKNSELLRKIDIQNLKITTIKDLATHLYNFSKTRPSVIPDFIKSSIILYQRNKELCFYQ